MAVFDSLKQKFYKDARKGLPIGAKEAMEAVSKGEAILIDVREKEEIRSGMAEPALWLATSEIESKTENYKNFVASLPKDKELIIYCAAGVRAGRFAEDLSNDGYLTRNMGGFFSWLDAGLPCKR